MTKPLETFVYPQLGSRLDLGGVRLAGAGLGNSLLTYFEAFLYARRFRATLVAPAWLSLKVGPLIRGERSSRLYAGLFTIPPDELTGFAKAAVLARSLVAHSEAMSLSSTVDVRSSGKLTIVRSTAYRFENIFTEREAIRQRLALISSVGLPSSGWGCGDYIAVHIRLGDFQEISTTELQKGGRNNARVPLSWYAGVILELRSLFPAWKIVLFSDGREAELRDLTSIPGVSLRQAGNDLEDLLSLAGSRLLVGSLSTFSYWGAFLGDQPTIWYERATKVEPLSSDPRKQMEIGGDTGRIAALVREAT